MIVSATSVYPEMHQCFIYLFINEKFCKIYRNVKWILFYTDSILATRTQSI